MLALSVMLSRMRRTAGLIGLRLVGLTLAGLVAAAVPAFVAASMEQVLQKQLAALPESPAVVVSWTAPDEEEHQEALDRLTGYLERTFAAGSLVTLPTTGQRAVQQYGPDGRLRAAKRYLALGVLPPEPAGDAAPGAAPGAPAQGAAPGAPAPGGGGSLPLAAGRLPAAGKPEVVLSEDAMLKAGYQIGDRLRVPLTALDSGPSADVTVVGTFRLPESGYLASLQGILGGTMLTSTDYFTALEVPAGEQTWVADLAGGKLRTATLADLAETLQELPLRLTRLLPEASIVTTPVPWVQSFLAQMAATRRLLVVLLTPVFLLILFFALATANAVVSGRRSEIAVLRSRGLTLFGVLRYYSGESLALAGAATGLALLLTVPAVRLMGLSAGFLKLVGRPPLLVAITSETLLYALAAALLAEAVSLIPLVQAARLTVATIRQEAATRSPVLAALRAAAEAGVVAVVAYGSWRLLTSSVADDPLYLALPALALAGAGVVVWRAMSLLLALLWRLVHPWLSPALHLSLGLLRSQPGRYQALWLMLVVTAGLGIYGAAFARTLDRDLVARVQYKLGADLVLLTAWETEVLSVDSSGNPEEVVYLEPPYSRLQDLPGAQSTARVQRRQDVSVLAGTRNLGKVNVMAISPQEFGRTARFLSELAPQSPAFYLNALAADEQAILASEGAAQRLGLKPGDRLKLRQSGSEVQVTVAAVVPQFPGQLPEDGDFLVGSLDYLQDGLGLLPYQVWVRLEPDASLQPLVDALHGREIGLIDLEDRRSHVAAGRREPLRLALYATLSAGFAIALLVMTLTYLLNVGLTLQSRAKELGVLRAMGMKARQVAASLYTEQLLMVGTAAATGLAVGGLASDLYVPVLRRQPGEGLLPLRIAAVSGERAYLLIGFTVALAVGAAVVGLWLFRLAINKALRLGEDG